jgi:hypothetical protein
VLEFGETLPPGNVLQHNESAVAKFTPVKSSVNVFLLDAGTINCMSGMVVPTVGAALLKSWQ